MRIEAARLREKLREYYGTDGQGDPIRIVLPKGGYTPHIEFRHSATPEPQPPDATAPDRSPDLKEEPALADERRLPELPSWKRGIGWHTALPVLALILVLGAAGA